MYQIVYVSTATREYGKDELERILAVSRRNNSADGVTGMLCYHGGTFFQMLLMVADEVRRVPYDLVQVSYTMGATRRVARSTCRLNSSLVAAR